MLRSRHHTSYIDDSLSKTTHVLLMLETETLNPRKRRFRDCEVAGTQKSSHNTAKRRKCASNTTRERRFWSNLSKVHLTKAAFKEFDHRNHSLFSEDCVSSIGRHTRTYQQLQPLVGAEEYVQNCSAATIKGLKELARRGGPIGPHEHPGVHTGPYAPAPGSDRAPRVR